ncbi:MAG: T9SS type A sorting domain-containing protein, partial [Bacteroidota bacterium]|nr:T9SS type A sorting domain-containing protein [Bacteroidota bacterium]
GKLLAIERRQMVSAQDTIFLNLTGVRAQQYQFEFAAQNMNVGGLQGFVEDTYLNTKTPIDLNGTTLFDFTIVNIPGSYAPGRFRIVFASSVALPVTFTSVKAYRQASNINVEWKVENEKNVSSYAVEKSVDGLRFTTMITKAPTGNTGSAASYSAIDIQPVTGYNYYRIRVTDADAKIQVTSIVKVFMGSIMQDISIYPNPITDGMIHLQFMNEPAGKYGIRLLNKLGQVIVAKDITRADGNSTELIKWDFNLAHGIYQLEIKKPDGSIKDINVLY